jgi:hypothetical protein
MNAAPGGCSDSSSRGRRYTWMACAECFCGEVVAKARHVARHGSTTAGVSSGCVWVFLRGQVHSGPHAAACQACVRPRHPTWRAATCVRLPHTRSNAYVSPCQHQPPAAAALSGALPLHVWPRCRAPIDALHSPWPLCRPPAPHQAPQTSPRLPPPSCRRVKARKRANAAQGLRVWPDASANTY